jgi:hypothetical protein
MGSSELGPLRQPTFLTSLQIIPVSALLERQPAQQRPVIQVRFAGIPVISMFVQRQILGRELQLQLGN